MTFRRFAPSHCLALVALVGCTRRAPTPSPPPARREPAVDVPAVRDVLAAQRDTAVDAAAETSLTRFSSVSINEGAACGIRADGRVLCWLGNESHWAPPGEIARQAPVPRGPFFVDGMEGAEALCANSNMLCARLRSGEVRCRASVDASDGASDYEPKVLNAGRVVDVPPGSTLSTDCLIVHPDGTRHEVRRPVGLAGVWREGPLRRPIRECELRDGSPLCVGDNSAYTSPPLLANARTRTFTREAPSTLFGLRDVREVAFAWGHACAVLVDGSARCWGRNLGGELGTGDTRSRATPVPVVGLSEVRALRLSSDLALSCAIRTSGEVWCWGSSNNNLFGVEGVTSRLTPTAIPGLTEVIELTVERDFACALKRDRTVWCWGDSAYGATPERLPPWQLRPVSIAP